MMHLTELHAIVRAQVRAAERPEERQRPATSATALSLAECRALAAWLRLPVGADGRRPTPIVGSEEWAESPAPGR
jgi:hypothetical protein